MQETTRAVKELGMAGVALFVGPTAKPPDMACFEGLYRTCEELGATVWVHPCRPQSYADYDAYKVQSSWIVLSRLRSLGGGGREAVSSTHNRSLYLGSCSRCGRSGLSRLRRWRSRERVELKSCYCLLLFPSGIRNRSVALGSSFRILRVRRCRLIKPQLNRGSRGKR